MEKYTDFRQWCTKFMDEFSKESDRAAAILSAIMLDAALEALLKKKLVKVSKSKEKLIGKTHTPISNFAAKIDLTYRLGLISQNCCNALHLIREIRNDFAHDIEGCNFQNQIVQKKINQIMQECDMSESITQENKDSTYEGRMDFQLIISWILLQLFIKNERIRRIKNNKNYIC